MNIIVKDTYQELSKQIVDDLIQFVSSNSHPLVCTASGDSPKGVYEEIVRRVEKNELDVSQWNFVGLDEWANMNGNDEGSCRYHLNQHFFSPLKISNDRVCFFDGRADAEKECEQTETFIQQHGSINVAILGLGMNGHIGMNEPGTSPALRSHVADIDPQTQQVGQKYFSSQQQLSHGITLGIATLMDAKHIILVVNGTHKAGIVKRILESEISEQLPATLLRNHPGFNIYLDSAAAQFTSSHA